MVTKDDLLSELGFQDEKQELEKLSWDQRGWIDYDVLLRGGFLHLLEGCLRSVLAGMPW